MKKEISHFVSLSDRGFKCAIKGLNLAGWVSLFDHNKSRGHLIATLDTEVTLHVSTPIKFVCILVNPQRWLSQIHHHPIPWQNFNHFLLVRNVW